MSKFDLFKCYLHNSKVKIYLARTNSNLFNSGTTGKVLNTPKI